MGRIARPLSAGEESRVNNQGQMLRLGTLLSVRDISGPVMVMRYNMYSSTAITGNAAPGISSGHAIALMGELSSREMPRSMRSEWTELTFLQLQAGSNEVAGMTLRLANR
jgi:multidrug efflux pump subunit AcrB